MNMGTRTPEPVDLDSLKTQPSCSCSRAEAANEQPHLCIRSLENIAHEFDLNSLYKSWQYVMLYEDVVSCGQFCWEFHAGNG